MGTQLCRCTHPHSAHSEQASTEAKTDIRLLSGRQGDIYAGAERGNTGCSWPGRDCIKFRPHTLDQYIENAETLAQNVVNAWGLNMQAGNGPLLTDEFKDLLDKACRFRTLKTVTENHTEFGMLTKGDEAELKTTRQAFAEAYYAFDSRTA